MNDTNTHTTHGMNPPLAAAIDALAEQYDASRRQRSTDWRVRLHMADKLGVPEEEITDADVHYFCTRMGAVYLSRKVRGIGTTIAERLCHEAAAALAEESPVKRT